MTTATARAAVATAAGRIELRTLALPPPAEGEHLVRVRCATICESDRRTFRGERPAEFPLVLGHEIVGELLTEAEVPALPSGSRVVWAVVAACDRCRPCKAGHPQKCHRGHKYGHTGARDGSLLSGGFATHVRLVPGTRLFPVPDALPDAVAASASCAGATAAAVLEALVPPPGPRAEGGTGPPRGLDAWRSTLAGAELLVTGLGLLGLLVARWARDAGARVHAEDPDPDRRTRAREALGLETAPPPAAPGGARYDLAVEASGAAAAHARVIDAVRPGGRIVLAGAVAPSSAAGIDPERIVRGLLTVVGVHNYAPRHLARALELLVPLAPPLLATFEAAIPLEDLVPHLEHGGSGWRIPVVPHGP